MESNRKIDLEKMRNAEASELFDFLDELSDDDDIPEVQAIDSDIGGDSDADDTAPISKPTTADTSGRNKRSYTEISDFDSDDSVADPNYIPASKRMPVRRLSSYSSSSDEEHTLQCVSPTPIQSGMQATEYSWSKSPYFPHLFDAASFVEMSGPNIETSQSPIEIFLQIFGEDLFLLIVNESNLYAQQKGTTLDLSVEELKAFFGMLVIMGFKSLPSLRLYWSTDSNFRSSRISDIMPLKRFLKILRHLHISNNENMPKVGDPNFDKLYKVRPLISYLRSSFLNSYNPSRNLSVDESMVAFKGRTHLKQYMPLKPIKRGIKIWALACADTGYLLNFSVYEGKKSSDEEGSLGERTVLELTQPYQDKNYCVYSDNFFTSFSLLSKLLDRKICSCGTMRANRKHFPTEFLKPDKNLQVGESDSIATGIITVDKWKDRGKKCVVIASTIHNANSKSTVERMTKEGVKVTVACPKSIADYNKNMGGVDLFDQLHACYRIAWKSRKWWLKIFYYFVDASIVNSFMIYKTTLSQNQPRNKSMTHLTFRSILANQLIGEFSSRKTLGSWLVIVNAVVSISIVSIPPIHASAGDRYRREAASDGAPPTAEEHVPEACKPFVNVTNNQFFSPGYPGDNYTNNTECVLVLEAPPGHLIKLDFRDWFQIEQSAGCKNDYLEVRDGAHGFNSLLHPPFCGIDVFPPMMTSSDRHLWIHFRSDENIEYKGFKAVFEFVRRPWSLPTPEAIPCYMNHTLKEEGEFGKDDIDNDTMTFYKKNDMPIDCLWSVTVKPKWRVYLQFAEFNLEKPNDCSSNFVQVFSGKTDMPSCDKEFCGSIADTVLSKGSKMFVRFFSESKSNKTLFKANFTAFRDLGTDKNQKCLGDEYYCEDATCIHESLKCNGNFNCRYRWDEEDDDCQNSQSYTWSGEHIIIIMVIFSLILTGMCVTFVYNCITKLIRDHRTIQEYIRQSREQQLNEIEKQEPPEKRPPSKAGSRSRSHSTHSTDSSARFDAVNAANAAAATPCYVPGGDVLPILIRHDHSVSPSNGDAYNTNIYTVDNESPPQMCDSACQTRESLFTTQGYSSGNSTPSHSVHTNSPPAPFSTFGYKKEAKFKAEARIEMTPNNHVEKHQQKRRPYSVQTTKSAPDVIVTH